MNFFIIKITYQESIALIYITKILQFTKICKKYLHICKEQTDLNQSSDRCIMFHLLCKC